MPEEERMIDDVKHVLAEIIGSHASRDWLCEYYTEVAEIDSADILRREQIVLLLQFAKVVYDEAEDKPEMKQQLVESLESIEKLHDYLHGKKRALADDYDISQAVQKLREVL